MTFRARPGKLSKTKPARLHPGPDLNQTAHYNSIERRFGYSFVPRQAPNHEPVRGGPDQVLRQQLETAEAALAKAQEQLKEKDEMIHHLSSLLQEALKCNSHIKIEALNDPLT